MNGDRFQKWWEEQLLPELPQGSAIIMDNAPYHTITTDETRSPTTATRKAEIQQWLTKQGLPPCYKFIVHMLHSCCVPAREFRLPDYSCFCLLNGYYCSQSLYGFKSIPVILAMVNFVVICFELSLFCGRL